ncbi:hypothetical protein [Nocardioides speluncae]|uniref:hypothetical protein n=1 Tax=Nocardioides speluncae TaxID=2670337 RepID=UPI00197FAA67|nr:hypothetical protein [Nocardioides speluncae]
MPNTTTDLDPAQIAVATGVIPDVFLNSPQFIDPMLTAALGRPVVVKVETANPLRSFKGRGQSFCCTDSTRPVRARPTWSARQRGTSARP